MASERLERAFKMLGRVEWNEGAHDYALIHDGSRGFWVNRRYGDMEWNWNHFASDHEAESLLLREMLDKADEKDINIQALSGDYRTYTAHCGPMVLCEECKQVEGEKLYWSDTRYEELQDIHPAFFGNRFDALLNALENQT